MARAIAALALLILTAACHREPGFDERYASDEVALRDKAASIDSDLAARESEAAQAGATDAASEAEGP